MLQEEQGEILTLQEEQAGVIFTLQEEQRGEILTLQEEQGEILTLAQARERPGQSPQESLCSQTP